MDKTCMTCHWCRLHPNGKYFYLECYHDNKWRTRLIRRLAMQFPMCENSSVFQDLIGCKWEAKNISAKPY